MLKTTADIKKITIIGLGVIGGSWGLAVKRVRPDIIVCGLDIDASCLAKAKEAEIIDWSTLNIAEAVADADIVVIACSLSQIINTAKRVLPHMKEGSILTDVGSVKELIAAAIEDILPDNINYVPGHPMAGSEKIGIAGADTYLFENAAYILTPTSKTASHALNIINDLVESMGARPLLMNPKEHDIQVAAVSHLPHVLASLLVNSVGNLKEQYPNLFLLAAGGFRDTTRIASSHPEMWKDITLSNRTAILKLIGNFEDELKNFKQALNEQEDQKIYNTFSQAKSLREEVPAGIKGLLPAVFEIVVVVPDKPGMIGEIANLLGENNINIIDIEILRVREGDGGTIRFGFLQKEQAFAAVKLLKQKGFGVNPRFDA